jgi:MFS family permease
MAIWGISMGTQVSIMRAAVADFVPGDMHATGFGMFHMSFGFAWFLGSALMGVLYDLNAHALVMFSVAIQIRLYQSFSKPMPHAIKDNVFFYRDLLSKYAIVPGHDHFMEERPAPRRRLRST